MTLLKPKVLRFDSLPSTNTELARLASEGAEEGVSIVADEQTASVAIYDAVQAGRDNEAFTLAVTVSLIAGFMLYLINRFGRVGW